MWEFLLGMLVANSVSRPAPPKPAEPLRNPFKGWTDEQIELHLSADQLITNVLIIVLCVAGAVFGPSMLGPAPAWLNIDVGHWVRVSCYLTLALFGITLPFSIRRFRRARAEPKI